MHNISCKACVCDTTVNYAAGEPIYKCEIKVCNINPGSNDWTSEVFMLWAEAEKVNQWLFLGLKRTCAKFKYDFKFIKCNKSTARADLFAMEALQSKTFIEYWKEVRNMNNCSGGVDRGCTESFSRAWHQIFRTDLTNSNTLDITYKYIYPVSIIIFLAI